MGFSFNTEEVTVSNEFAPIAPGIYNVKFETIEEALTKNNEVKWSAKMKIVDSGRTFFLNWNVGHTSEKARNFAMSEVKGILEAMGVSGVVNINSLRTNATFSVQLEQSPFNDKVYYQTKGPWKLAEAASAPVKATVPTAEKRKNPWDKK